MFEVPQEPFPEQSSRSPHPSDWGVPVFPLHSPIKIFFLRSYFKLKLSNLIKVNFTCGNMVKSRTGPFSFQCIRRHRNIIALSWSKSCYNCPCHVRTASDYTACIKWYWIKGAFPEVNSIALKSSIVKPLRKRIPRNLELRCCYLREHYIVRCTTRN